MLKCLLLFSGGLDSILAVKVLEKQKIKVTLIFFKSYFFDAQKAKKVAQELGYKLKVIDFGDEHFKKVKKPQHGYGKNMNPCLDCHLLMLKKAKELMQKEKYDFIATGEVLGQRPMTQTKHNLQFLTDKSDLKNKLLRPLSAQLLEPLDLEKSGHIDRLKLLNFQGRTRKPQMRLAKESKIKNYPHPAGGCLLTDEKFSGRLKNLLKNKNKITKDDIELLKYGRHFWLNKNLIVIGRHQEDNRHILKLAQLQDWVLQLKNFKGPIGLIRGSKINQQILKLVSQSLAWYHTQARQKKEVKVQIRKDDKINIIIINPHQSLTLK
ncbi:MAG: tRNA 4-thiouridine(8) synthase ThiI [Patescibacteria group bacterium]|nr:tRNA 4-thiouridine(8) synthase ThiI [Patescibacteria group bacterium]